MFQVGQLVVSIHKNSSGHFKKGEIFTIKEVRKASCDCMECIVDIGKESLDEMQVCEDCNTKFFDTSTALWFSNRYFAPADTSFARNILWHIANEIENEYWKNNL